MQKLFFITLVCCAVLTCNAQEKDVIVGKVLEDGTVQREVSDSVLFNALLLIHPVPVARWPVWFRVKFSEGMKRNLVCAFDTFIIAFECRRIGDNIIIHSDGITHIGKPDKCLNPEFLFADDGEIVGCTCGDKLYEGPPRTCNHSMETTQAGIVAAIAEAKRSTD